MLIAIPYGVGMEATQSPCWLCHRLLGQRMEWHHPVPKSRGGRETVWPVRAVSGGAAVTVAAELYDGALFPVGVWPQPGYVSEVAS